MTTEDLKEYLSIVVDMEQSIFLQVQLCRDIETEIQQLQIPKEIADPSDPEKPAPPPPPPVSPKAYKAPHGLGGIIGGCIGLFFGGGVFGLILGSLVHSRDLSGILALLAPIVWIVFCIRGNLVARQKSAEDFSRYQHDIKYYELDRKKDQEQHQQKLNQYRAVLAENQRLRQQDETERKLKTSFLSGQKDEIEKALSISKSHLDAIYQKDIIFPKYRNLVMVCSLQEYISAGLCTTLEGPDGAYNLLETYMRLDRISTQLDRVISNLEFIRENQFMLYSAVQEANRRLGQLTDSIRQMTASLGEFYHKSLQSAAQLNIQLAEMNAQNAQLTAHLAELQKSSELTAYHTERAQKELAYMNRINYLSGKNDDVFFNHPPL